MVMPGDNVEMTVELIAPIAIEDGTRFSIREGGRTVGSGVVTEIFEYINYLIQRTPFGVLFVHLSYHVPHRLLELFF